MIDPVTVFKDGATYEIVYSSDKPKPPEPTGKDIYFNLTIKNSSASSVDLKGEVCFVLANPDKDGVYYGWEGIYNRTGHIKFSAALTLKAGESKTFSNVFAPEMGGRNLLNPDLLKSTDYKTNVLLYDPEGVSDTIIPENMSPDIIFENNGSYTVTIP